MTYFMSPDSNQRRRRPRGPAQKKTPGPKPKANRSQGRSGEGRGGEKGRTRGAPDHLKKKKNNYIESELYTEKIINKLFTYTGIYSTNTLSHGYDSANSTVIKINDAENIVNVLILTVAF